MSTPGKPLRLAVVGHTNAGKTSLLQTLLRRRDFGEVSARGGATRAVEAGGIADGAGVVAVLLDTPGFEEADRLRDAMASARSDRYDDPRTLLDRFLASPAAADDGDLGLEAAAVRAALDADVLLYAIDAREDPKPRHLDELAVLAATARPLVPVLNYTARPESHPARWRDACARQGLHATVAFDAVVYDDAGERRLLAAVKALAPGHDGAVDRWIGLRARERGEAIDAATGLAAEFLVTAAAAVAVTPPKAGKETDRQAAVDAATAGLLDSLRHRETETRDRIAAAFGFRGAEARAVTFDVAEALGGVDFLSRASLERTGLWAAGAGAGLVTAGALVDIAVGGVSLGGFAALGAVGSALGAAGASGRKVLRRLFGQHEVRLGDAAVDLLAARAAASMRAMLARGHAAIEPVPIESAVQESLERDAGPAWRAAWAPARGRAGWSDLSRPRPGGVAGHARAETVDRVAAALAGRIRERPGPGGATAAPPTSGGRIRDIFRRPTPSNAARTRPEGSGQRSI